MKCATGLPLSLVAVLRVEGYTPKPYTLNPRLALLRVASPLLQLGINELRLQS